LPVAQLHQRTPRVPVARHSLITHVEHIAAARDRGLGAIDRRLVVRAQRTVTSPGDQQRARRVLGLERNRQIRGSEAGGTGR